MSEGKKNNKGLIIGIIAAVAVVVGVVVAIILCTNKAEQLGDNYFKDSDNRVVYSASVVGGENGYGAIKTHQVYDVDKDTVKGYTLYYEFSNEDSAKKANERIQNDIKYDKSIIEAKLDGKYIGIKYNETAYSDTTASELRTWVNNLREYDESREEEKLEWIPEDTFDDEEEESVEEESSEEELDEE